MDRTLIFGFEKFGLISENPTTSLVNHIIKINPKINSLILPVSEYAWDILKRRIDELTPKTLIGFGVAPGRTKVSAEVIAINKKHHTNLEEYPITFENKSITENSDLAIESNIDLKKLIDFLKMENVSIDYSFNPGTFICNQIYYNILKNYKDIKCVFIHIPLEKEEKIVKDNKEILFPKLPTLPLAKGLVKYLENYEVI